MRTQFLSTVVKVLAGSIALFAAGSASSAILAAGTNTGPLRSPYSFTASFNNFVHAATGDMVFDLLGYRSLDGVNRYQDVFTLTVNGTDLFTGSFNMGGGGTSEASGPAGTSWSTTSPGLWRGGSTHVALPIPLVGGLNSIEFAYTSPTSFRGRGQGLWDEGWGVGSYSVTAVPEPETYAMLLAGLGLVGAAVRRRRKA